MRTISTPWVIILGVEEYGFEALWVIWGLAFMAMKLYELDNEVQVISPAYHDNRPPPHRYKPFIFVI